MKRALGMTVLFGFAVLVGFAAAGDSLPDAAAWRRKASPGPLSEAHAFLGDDCASCHTPVRGVEAAGCAVCHAENAELLGRQPTAFHAAIPSCAACHVEHQGGSRGPTSMDHAALARIGLGAAGRAEGDARQARDRLIGWIRHAREAPPAYPSVSAEEAVLDCASCHSTKDRHAGFFGADCARCHGTEQWTIAEFRHPSPRSTGCAECHQAPPSHYMEHFAMVSAKVAAQPDARVDQCYVCHQTTAWNDIKGVGWYKHH